MGLASTSPLMNLHAPFARGGTVSGQVTNTSGVGVPNASMHIASPSALPSPTPMVTISSSNRSRVRIKGWE